MEQSEKLLNPEESLRVIRETIDLAKSRLGNNGFHFLLWGWLVMLASVADYYMVIAGMEPQSHLVWAVMPLIGLPVAMLYEWRRDKTTNQSANIVHHWYGYIWLAFGISLIIIIPLSIRAGTSPVPFIMVLGGFATFMSGTLLRFTPLIYGAAVIWTGAALCMFLSPLNHLLVQAGAMVFGYLVPGYWLNREASRKRHV